LVHGLFSDDWPPAPAFGGIAPIRVATERERPEVSPSSSRRHAPASCNSRHERQDSRPPPVDHPGGAEGSRQTSQSTGDGHPGRCKAIGEMAQSTSRPGRITGRVGWKRCRGR
jgi:hypothetical protein